MLALTLLSVVFASTISAQNASTASLALVNAQFAASGLAADTPRGFGFDLVSQALLQVRYGFGVVTNGAAYSAAQVAQAPQIAVIPVNASQTNFVGQTFTLMLADASSIGDLDPEGNYRHYLGNSVTIPATTGSSFAVVDGTTITSYAGPGPLPGTGPHRYAWMLFTEPTPFTPPAGLNASGTPPGHWDVFTYVQGTQLTLIAASFFTVENGAATGSVVSTTAVNTATLIRSSSSSVLPTLPSLTTAVSTMRPVVSSALPSLSSAAASAAASASQTAVFRSAASGLQASLSLASVVMISACLLTL